MSKNELPSLQGRSELSHATGVPEWKDDLVIPFPVTAQEAAALARKSEYMLSVRVEENSASVTKAMPILLPEQWPQDFDPWNAEIDLAAAKRGEHYQPRFLQTVYARIVLQNRERIEVHGRDVLKALFICLRFGLTPSDWLRDVALRQWARVERLECGSLDYAFGHRPMTQRGRNMMRGHHAVMPKLFANLVLLLKRNPKRPINNALFADAGALSGIGRTQARAVYREGLKHGFPDVDHLRRWLLLGKKF